MKKTTVIILIVTLGTTGIFSFLIYYSLLRVYPSEISAEAADGKRIWETYACMECHTILGNGGYSATDLTNILSQRGEKWLEDFFSNPPIMRPSRVKHHLGLDKHNTGNLIEYFKMIEQINTLAWPPSPLLKQSNE